MRRVLLAAAAMALSVGILAAIGGVAAAKGKPTPVTATGNTTCNYHGQLVLNSDSTLSLSGNLTPHQGPACTSTGGSKLRAGHMNQTLPTTIPTTATDLCPFVAAATSLSVPLPDLLGGDIAWSPRAKVAGSTGVRLVGGSLSVSGTSLVLTYLFSSVASGSFTGSFIGPGSALMASTDLASVQAACASGPVTSIPLGGTLSL